MTTKYQQLGMAVLLIAIGSAACKKTTIGDIKSNDKVFSPSLFKENIINALGSPNIGYTFMINHNGKWADSAARGFARMKQDGAIFHSVNKEMNLADRYVSLMQQLVFTPAGVANATCTPELRSIQTLMYNETLTFH